MSHYQTDREAQESRLEDVRRQRHALNDAVAHASINDRTCEWMLYRLGDFYRTYRRAYAHCSYADIKTDLENQFNLILARIARLGRPHRGRLEIFRAFLLDGESILYAAGDGVILKRETSSDEAAIIAHCDYDHLLEAVLSVHKPEEEMALMEQWADAFA
jgi:hypothetical protein